MSIVKPGCNPLIFPLLFLMTTLVFLSSCAPTRQPVPTGTIPKATKVSISDEQYGHKVLAALTERYQLDYNHPRYSELTSVVERLTQAAQAAKSPWHVYLLKDDTNKNAAATRGNHVFIWTGMLNATKNTNELAVVLAHEIGHVLAHHTDPDPNEQIKELLVGIGAMAAGIAIARTTGNPNLARPIGDLTSSAAKEIGSGLLVYPYSREREAEADQIGLFLMADAKFNPQASIDFWTRAQDDPSFSQGIAFLSTHPPARQRLEYLKRLLPRAMDRYNGGANYNQPLPSPRPNSRKPASGNGDSFDISPLLNQQRRY